MKLTIAGDTFLLDGHPTYTAHTGFPEADSRLAGLLLNHRVVNGIFEDLAGVYDAGGGWDAEANTEHFVEAMSTWREQGVIAFTIGLQGGNPFPTSPPPAGCSTEELDCGAFEADGSLRPAFMARLKRILDRAKALDMVPIINYFYQGGNRRIREEALGAAVDNATAWLLENGYDGLIIDLANECDARRYWPALQPLRIHELIYRLKDDVILFNNRRAQERAIYVSASFTAGYSIADRLAELADSFVRAVDLFMPHGNGRTTEEIRETIVALRQRARSVGKEIPIVYNEDIRRHGAEVNDAGGDLEHLEACVEVHVSWGNLIRSHQRVPCIDWVSGSEVQRQWFEATRRLAGPAKPPSSVCKFARVLRYRAPR